MNTHFHQTVVKAGSGGDSLARIPGLRLAIVGNLNGQIKKHGDFVLYEGKTLPLKVKQMEYGKIEEIKNGMNCTIHTRLWSNIKEEPYLQTSYH